MAKYNINPEPQEKAAAYRNTISSKLMDSLEERIRDILLLQQKYLDASYSARQLAADLESNPRYVSATLSVRFHMNYTSLVNKYRVQEAMSLLADKEHDGKTMEEVGCEVGFANRQSFYAAFYKYTGITPRDYKMNGKEAAGPMGAAEQ